MTQYFKDLLEKLRAGEPAKRREHHLFLLGTAVNYIDRPTKIEEDKFYIRGETFSYTAQVVSHILGEKDDVVKHADAADPKSENYAHAYHSPSVDVINGPDTPGFEIGDRLAKALLLALGAVAEGKDELHISGFSRGAVESIVLTHELERVKEQLKADLEKAPDKRQSLGTIIANSSSVPGLSLIRDPSYTKAELNKLVDKDKEDDDEELKRTLLENLEKLQVHLFALDPVPGGNFAKVARIGWQEEKHFYTLPEFVVKKHEFVQQHETSNCFKPIIPLGMPYEVIPGCHGTGDGNQFDHNGDPVPDKFAHMDLSGVQDLVLRRWYDFTFPEQMEDFEIDLGHPELDAVSNAYLPEKERGRNEQLLQNYKIISKNYPAFEWLASRNYNGLGRYMAERMVHFHQRGNVSIRQLDVHGGGKFLNLQHVQLWMSNQLSAFNFFEKTLLEQVEWLQDNIENAFKEVDLSHSIGDETQMIANLVANEKNHPLLIESLSFLVNTVTQTYMRNHLSEKDRSACRDCVIKTFESLEAAKRNLKSAELAGNIYNSIRHDLTTTMLKHQNALLSMAEKLLQEQDEPEEDIEVTDKEIEAVQEVDELKSSVSKRIKNEKIRVARLNWLSQAQKLYDDLGLLGQQIEALEDWCDKDLLLEAWGKILPNFTLEAEKDTADFAERKAQLLRYIEQQRLLLSDSASEVLRNLPDALEKKPAEIDEEFYKQILRQARLELLEKQVEVQSDEIEKQRRRINEINSAYELSQEEVQSLTHELEVRTEERDTLQREKLKVQQTLEEEHLAHRSAQEKVQSLTEERDTLRQEKSEVQKKLEKTRSAKEKLEENLQKQKESAEQLSHELEHAKKENAQHKLDKEHLEEKLQQQKTTLTENTEEIQRLQKELDDAKEREQQLKSAKPGVTVEEYSRVQERLRKAQSREEKRAAIQVEKLLTLCTSYLEHLEKSHSDPELLEKKIKAVTKMKGILENNDGKDILPSEQLVEFAEKLQKTQDTLKEHRDPAWQRFFRDCLRIIAIAISGVGLYRVCKGESPHFFKPSHGERFIEQAEQEQKIQNPLSR